MAAHQDRVEQIAAIAQELKYALPLADVCSHVSWRPRSILSLPNTTSQVAKEGELTNSKIK